VGTTGAGASGCLPRTHTGTEGEDSNVNYPASPMG
jgi:hypothetical protein